MDPPPPYQAIAPGANTLHVPIPQRAGDVYNKGPSRPATPSPSTDPKRPMHRLLSHNLWQDAVEKLSETDKESLEIPKSGASSTAIIEDALARVRNSQDKVNRNLIQVTTEKGQKPLRHYVDKFTKAAIQFREIGDTLVQYDPGHAALPWAGVRFLLNIAVNDSMSFQAMAEGIDLVSAMITRYAVVESLYLLEESTLRAQLTSGITKLYVSILRYLSGAKTYYNKSTTRRVVEGAVKSSHDLVEVPIGDVRADHEHTTDEAAGKKDSDRKLSAIQGTAESTLDELERLRKLSRDMMKKLDPIDELTGEINEMRIERTHKPPEPAFLEAYNAQKKDADEKNADQPDRLSVKALTDLIPKLIGDRTTIILIDALDECAGKPELLESIKTIMDKASVKVIISGRSEVCQTPLIAAAKAGNHDLCRLLLAKGAFVDFQAPDDDTALIAAAEAGKLSTVQMMLKSRADVKIVGRFKRTALLAAAIGREEQFHDIVRLLIRNGAGIDAQDSDGETALHSAARAGDLDLVRLLISKKAKINVKNDEGRSALDFACGENHLEVIQYLLNHDAVCEPDASGRTELHEIIGGHGKCDADTIKLFVSKGVNINATDDENISALHLAPKRGDQAIVQALIAAGADVNVKSDTAAMMLLETGEINLALRTQYGFSVLDNAASEGDYELVRSLLQRGADCAQTPPGDDSALHWAVRAEKDDNLYAIVELLLEKGCDVNARSRNGCTPLHTYLSLKRGKENVVRLFLARGADINIQDNDGDSVLNCLAQSSQASESMLELLLENNADSSLANNKGLTPVHQLAKNGSATLLRKLLKQTGAHPSAKDRHNRQPIQYAARTNEATSLDFDVDVNVTGSDWPSPIVYASSEANLQVLRLLLAHKADAKSEDPGNPGWTALHAGCKRSDPDPAFAEELIKHGADVNAVTKISKTTPLHNAVSSAAVIELLLKEGALVDPQDSDGKTPLILACEDVNSARVVELLIKANANPMIKDKTFGATGLHCSCFSDELAHIVIQSGKCDDLNVKDKQGYSPLAYAAFNARSSAVKRLLQTGKIKLYNDGPTAKPNACMFAAQVGSAEVVKLLIEYDESIVLKVDNHKDTALHYACRNGHLGVVRLLLQNDASNIEAVNTNNCTAFDVAAEGGHTDIVAFMLERDDVNPLHISERNYIPLLGAAWTGKQDLIEMLMTVKGTDLRHMSTGGRTLFTIAASVGLEGLCRGLIEQGVANGILPVVGGGLSPLHCATQSNKAGVIELVLEQPGVDKNICSDHGFTPLWFAVRNEKEKSVMTLLAHQVDVERPDDRARTPLFVAAQKSNEEIVRMLLNAGARAQLDEALEIALLNRDEEIVRLLREAGAVEHDEGFGVDELMAESSYQDPMVQEMQATAGSENIEEI
ncbi:hypothetical protein KCU65_g8285, partial [Aureobasidium melanogenum]